MQTFTFGTMPPTARERAEVRKLDLLSQLTPLEPYQTKSHTHKVEPGDWQLMQKEGAQYIALETWGETLEPFREILDLDSQLNMYDTGNIGPNGPVWDTNPYGSYFLGAWGDYLVVGWGGGMGWPSNGNATNAPLEVLEALRGRHGWQKPPPPPPPPTLDELVDQIMADN